MSRCKRGGPLAHDLRCEVLGGPRRCDIDPPVQQVRGPGGGFDRRPPWRPVSAQEGEAYVPIAPDVALPVELKCNRCGLMRPLNRMAEDGICLDHYEKPRRHDYLDHFNHPVTDFPYPPYVHTWDPEDWGRPAVVSSRAYRVKSVWPDRPDDSEGPYYVLIRTLYGRTDWVLEEFVNRRDAEEIAMRMSRMETVR